MKHKTPVDKVGRRGFLSGTVAAGAVLGLRGTAEATTAGATARDAAASGTAPSTPVPAPPAGSTAPVQTPDATAPASRKLSALPAVDPSAEHDPPQPRIPLFVARPGADFMVDVLKTLDVQYVAANPGSSFRGLQESVVNYGGNKMPEFLTCCHEESSVAIAHGYYKIAGKPMAAMIHGVVGVQHASMAIYNAYADRIPVLLLSGNALDANTRRVPAEWQHAVQDNAAMVRDYTKWDDTPFSLQHFAESMVRAHRLSTALPGAPVMITVDMNLQEDELTKAREAKLIIPKLTPDTPPRGDDGALKHLAQWLVEAERPVIHADRYARTDAAIPLLVELAELIQAPVIDTYHRMNFPTNHPLNQSGSRTLIPEADLILALEPEDLWGITHEIQDVIGRPWSSIIAKDCRTVSLGTSDLLIKANYQDFQRYSSADLAITGDPETSLPRLIELVRSALPSKKKQLYAARGRKFADAHRDTLAQSRAEAAIGWDLSPVHPARIVMELWDLVKSDDWSIVGNQATPPAYWAKRLWPMDRPYRHTGDSGGAGIGYGLPAAVGSALANRDHGRLSINFQNDGDFMYAPGALWTAAHHRIPLLTVMYNNRGYHQELMHLQIMAGRHNRGVTNAGIGTALRNPDFDYAKMAQSMGVYGEGPIVDPNDLRAALTRALAVVRRGEPALVDVVTQPR
jgi:acetolactate synthase I/II/III large subunit